MVTLLGIPYDESSSFLQGCAEAPDVIREAFHSPSSNTCAENEVDVAEHFLDAGNLQLATGAAARDEITTAVRQLLEDGQRVLSLGGDHAVTYPILRAYGNQIPNLTVLHLDAHPDLYDELDGNRYSHACPFARAFEDGVIGRLVQIGIRTMNAAQRKNADRFGVEVVTAAEFQSEGLNLCESLDGPVYISLDIDVLDPAFAPGISHYEPGGLSVRDVLNVIQCLTCQVVGADIVELNPSRDFQNQTAMVAAKFLKELTAKML